MKSNDSVQLVFTIPVLLYKTSTDRIILDQSYQVAFKYREKDFYQNVGVKSKLFIVKSAVIRSNFVSTISVYIADIIFCHSTNAVGESLDPISNKLI